MAASTLLAVALFAAAPPAAPAPEAESSTTTPAPELGDDLVRLKSGGRIRGQIVESVPDSHVTLIVLGEQRRIAWADVDGIDEGHFTEPEPPQEPKPEAEADESPLPDAKGVPFVTLRSTRSQPLKLQRLEREGMGSGYGAWGVYSFNMMQWKSACSEPCERRIDARKGQSFVVGDSPLTFSKSFSLDQQRGDVIIEGRPGNKAARVLGAVGLGLGIGLAVSSPLMFLFDDNQVVGFAALLGAGAALTVAGTFGLVYGRARVKVRPARRATASLARGGRNAPAATRPSRPAAPPSRSP